MGFVATAEIIGILWRGVAKATRAPRAAPFVVLRIYIEQVSKMLTLQGPGGKHLLVLSLHLEVDADVKMKGVINRRRLKLSLKLRGLLLKAVA